MRWVLPGLRGAHDGKGPRCGWAGRGGGIFVSGAAARPPRGCARSVTRTPDLCACRPPARWRERRAGTPDGGPPRPSSARSLLAGGRATLPRRPLARAPQGALAAGQGGAGRAAGDVRTWCGPSCPPAGSHGLMAGPGQRPEPGRGGEGAARGVPARRRGARMRRTRTCSQGCLLCAAGPGRSSGSSTGDWFRRRTWRAARSAVFTFRGRSTLCRRPLSPLAGSASAAWLLPEGRALGSRSPALQGRPGFPGAWEGPALCPAGPSRSGPAPRDRTAIVGCGGEERAGGRAGAGGGAPSARCSRGARRWSTERDGGARSGRAALRPLGARPSVSPRTLRAGQGAARAGEVGGRGRAGGGGEGARRGVSLRRMRAGRA